MLEIKQGFTTYDKKVFPNIRNISFTESNDIRKNLGEFINETKIEPSSFFGSSETETEGVYIYKTPYDENKAFRIYKDWSNNVFCNIEQHPREVEMLSKLIEKQEKVKLTDFPTGIITLNGYVIGQEIPLYEKSKTLQENLDILDTKKILKYYIDILEIIKELINNGIIYSDIHAKNFMLHESIIKLIDFEPHDISFVSSQYTKMISNLKFMMNRINEYKNIELSLKKEETINDIEETIMNKILK